MIHDFTVDRTTNGAGQVKEMTLSELKALTVGGDEKIPTFQEVLEVVKETPNVLLYVDVHVSNIEAQVIEQVQQYNFNARTFITSGFHEILKTLRNLDRSILTQFSYHYPLENPVTIAQELQVNAVNPEFKFLSKDLVQKCRQAGLHINTWVVNKLEDMRRIAKLGVDGIATDFPMRLQKLLQDAKSG